MKTRFCVGNSAANHIANEPIVGSAYRDRQSRQDTEVRKEALARLAKRLEHAPEDRSINPDKSRRMLSRLRVCAQSRGAKEQAREPSGRRRGSLILFWLSPLIVSWVGCATTTTQRWGTWQTGNWHASGAARTAVVTITSTPLGAEVHVDNRLAGTTPVDLRLPYTVEQRRRERVLYEDVEQPGGATGSYLMGLFTMGMVDRPSVRTNRAGRDVKTEYRSTSRGYNIRVSKEGYFSRTLIVSVPNDGGTTHHIRLARKLALAVYPVVIERGIRRETGVFTWLHENVFARGAIREDQYAELARRLTQAVRSQMATCPAFSTVRLVSADSVSSGWARLNVRMEIGGDTVLLEGQLSAPGVGLVTRRLSFDEREFAKQYHVACAKLTKEIVTAYLNRISTG